MIGFGSYWGRGCKKSTTYRTKTVGVVFFMRVQNEVGGGYSDHR